MLTEIVQRMRADRKGVSLEPAAQVTQVESIDPICNMTVDVAESRYQSNYNGTTFHLKSTPSDNPPNPDLPFPDRRHFHLPWCRRQPAWIIAMKIGR